jgi:ubiquinone/menaquinone biosynthesis C-methylase UbiE
MAVLPRVLEPEVMDSPEEAREYDAMDHSGVNQRFIDDFLRLWNGTGPILDVGTGTAQIPIILCRRERRARVVAIDQSEHMLRLAHANVEEAGLTDRLALERCDAKQLPFAARSFGAVISNSIIHHIPEPRSVLNEMVRVVKPNGLLFVRDLLRPPDYATVRHLVATYAGDANVNQQQMFEASLRAALTVAEMQALVCELGFPADSVQQTSDRHWTWMAPQTADESR